MSEKSNMRALLKSKLYFRPPVTQDPRTFGQRAKAIVLICIGLCASTSGFASTIYFPGLPAITDDLHAPPIATTLTAALFVLLMGIAPVFWASFSDNFHVRRIVLFTSMIIFAAASLGSAFINNIWGLVVLRCVQAVGSSCGQSVGAGVIADCYPLEQRGAAFGKFFFGVFFGPLLGPIIGGFLIMSDLSWRATFWFCVAFALFIACNIFFFFPETYRDDAKWDMQLPTTSAGDEASSSVSSRTLEDDRQSEQQEAVAEKGQIELVQDNNAAATAAVQPHRRSNPFAAFILLRHPFVLCAALVSGVAFGCMFAVETIIPDLYESHYGFNSWQTGLSYLGAGVGNLFGSLLGGMTSDKLLLRSRRLRGGRAVCEDRLTANLWFAFFFIILGVLLFGWGIEGNLSFWCGIIAFGIQTFGMNQVMTATSAYIVDANPGAGASATASANLVRMVMACVLTLIANPLVASIGPGYTCVFLAGLSVLGLCLLIILKLWGENMRIRAGFRD
ncbi:major facilitator superfamily domain-containing protein [Parasitella parasitica]|nr:major facilitator superfamily domain-containing protein [Parasitella parasitica]